MTIRLLPLALLLAAAPAPDPAGARAFVEGIYRAVPRSDFDYRKVRYAPALQRLLDRDRAQAGNEVGLLDAVPFCDCQDTAEDYRFAVQVAAPGPDRAVATVRLRNGGASTYRIDLVRLPAGWAVADIHGPTYPSLAGYLAKELAPARPRRAR